jgi:cell division protein FtsW (lipid II flippase)
MKVVNFIASLDVMWKGMVGLFGVCIFIMLLVMLIYRMMSKNRQAQE